MKKRILLRILLNLMMFSSISIVITVVIYFINVQFFSYNKYLSPTGFLFFEGILFLLVGFLLLLGRGGISLWSTRAAILSALAGAVFGDDTVGPDEILRRDRWKPEGFPRAALVLILAGIFMIIAYFITLK